MRKEISEPKHWRKRPASPVSRSSRRAALPLPADVVDAAFADDAAGEVSHTVSAGLDVQSYPELIATLCDQLAQLEAQQEQLRKLLG